MPNKKKHKLKPGDHFKPCDNTILDCPNVNYDYTWKTYLKTKRTCFIISVISLIAFIILLILLWNVPIAQTIISVILGGIISILVWLVTIYYKDKMEFQIENINYHIDMIDKYIDYMKSPIQSIDPYTHKIVQADRPQEYSHFLQFLQLCGNIRSDNIINYSQLQLKDFHGNLLELNVWIDSMHRYLSSNQTSNQIVTNQSFSDMLTYNDHELDTHLNLLKSKLQRCKYYTYSTNPPVSYNKEIVHKTKSCKIFLPIKQWWKNNRNKKSLKTEYKKFAKELMNISKNEKLETISKYVYEILTRYNENGYVFAKLYIEKKAIGAEQLFAILPRFESAAIGILCSFIYESIKDDSWSGILGLIIVLIISLLLSIVLTNHQNKKNQKKFSKNPSNRFVITILQKYCEEYENKIIQLNKNDA